MRKPVELLDLPAEIRNQIWKYALSYSTSHVVDIFRDMNWFNPSVLREFDSDAWFYHSAEDNTIKPHLLRVCKQIHHEATPIFYSNTFIDPVIIGTILTRENLKSFIRKLDLFVRPRHYNFKSIFVCLHCDGYEIDHIKSRQHRDASLVAHYANVMSRQCGTLDALHIQMADWSKNHIYRFNDDITIPLVRGFGLFHARKVTFGMLGSRIGFDLDLAIGQEEPRIPLRELFTKLYEISRYCGFDEAGLKRITEQNVIQSSGSEQALAEFMQSWESSLEKAIAILSSTMEVMKEELEFEGPFNVEREEGVFGPEKKKKIRRLMERLEGVVMDNAAQKLGELNADERGELEKNISQFNDTKLCNDLLDGWGDWMKEWDAYNEILARRAKGNVRRIPRKGSDRKSAHLLQGKE